MTHRYVLHGLSVMSDIRLPELEPSSVQHEAPPSGDVRIPQRAPDVSIRLSAGPEAVNDSTDNWFVVREDGVAVLRIPGLVTFEVRTGRLILVRLMEHADISAVRVFLLGSAFAVLQYQRRMLPLHVGAVAVDGYAIAFTAASGVGKSTLVSGLHIRADLPLIADDVATYLPPAATRTDEGGNISRLCPGPPIMKLLPDALANLGSVDLSVLPEYLGSPKSRIRPRYTVGPSPVPLAALVILERAPEMEEPGIRLRRCRGVDAFAMAQSAVYRANLGVAIIGQTEMFRQVSELAANVPVYRGQMSAPHGDAGVRERAIRRTLEQLVATETRPSGAPHTEDVIHPREVR